MKRRWLILGGVALVCGCSYARKTETITMKVDEFEWNGTLRVTHRLDVKHKQRWLESVELECRDGRELSLANDRDGLEVHISRNRRARRIASCTASSHGTTYSCGSCRPANIRIIRVCEHGQSHCNDRACNRRSAAPPDDGGRYETW